MTEQTPATDAALAARVAALDLVSAVLSRRVPFDDAWEGHRGIRLLEARDRAFVRLLCATVLRRLGQIDACIAACLDKPASS
jgi:16S rRNA (cytosine967-C5)-methyltransferase